MLRKVIFLALMIICFTIFKPVLALEKGDEAADFSAKDIEGNNISISAYEGDLIILYFWVIDMEECQEELKELERFYQEKREQVKVISVNEDFGDNISRAKTFAKDNLNFPTITDEERVLAYTYQGNIITVPYMLVIDRGGKVCEIRRGIPELIATTLRRIWQICGETEELTSVPSPEKTERLLRVESKPTGAEVYLNEKFEGKTPLDIDDIKQGEYTLRLTKSKLEKTWWLIIGDFWYLATSDSWKLLPPDNSGSSGDFISSAQNIGVPFKRTINLILPLGKVGDIVIKSNPEGAKVYLDGELKGETPLSIKGMLVGEYDISLEGRCGSWRGSVSLVEGKAEEINISLPSDQAIREAESLYLRGYNNYEMGNFESAKEDFEKAERLVPCKILYPYWLARSNYELDEFDKAEKLLQKVLQFDPPPDQEMTRGAQYMLARIEKYKKYTKEAVENFDEGYKYYQAGDYAKAIEPLKRAVLANEEEVENGLAHNVYIEAYKHLGVAYEKEGRFQEALEVFEKALSLDPDNKELKYFRNLIEEKLNQ